MTRGAPRPADTPRAIERVPGGVLAIDKPLGWTSHDAVAVARKVLGMRRVGHGGTLDPLATGVLPILAGPATRFVDRLHTAAKVYAALVLFGSETTTDDREGEVRATAEPPDLRAADLDRSLAPFRGDLLQVPPGRSAVKVGGRRAYALHRAGEDFTLEARSVRVHRLEIASWQPPALRVLIVCGSGTYVRALARDIGRSLGSAAHLGGLRRLAVGALDAGEATTVEQLRAAGRDAAVALLRPADDRLLEIAGRYLSEPAASILGTWEVA
ncbi:MAG: tRNA pseudouridine(55) synthase TruB [Candidatus Limnocylindria bacterium]